MTNDSSDRLSLKNQALERAARARKGGARKPNKPKAPPVFAPGARVVIRDEEWMVRRTTGAAFGGAAVHVTGLSELVRGKHKIFLTELDDVQELRPEETKLVNDPSPQFRRSKLYLESLRRKTPPTDDRIYVGQHAAMDRADYQLVPAAKALGQPRARILIADGVGLGKTLEVGILLSELIRRGQGERLLVVALKSILEQFQKELWGRFTIPLVRLDSVGLQRVQQKIPSNMNPFYYFDRVIISIDTLKNDNKYRRFLEECHWDAVVIDECQHVAVRTRGKASFSPTRAAQKSRRAKLAGLLARTCDSLILTSATPHDGTPRSFASLMNLLEPTAVANPDDYTADDIRGLYVRRFKKDVAQDLSEAFFPRALTMDRLPASAEEDAAFEALQAAQFKTVDRGRKTKGVLFRTTLLKSFLSSPAACRATVEERLKHKKLREDEGIDEDADHDREVLRALAKTMDAVKPASVSKLGRLVEWLRELGYDDPKSAERVVIFSERIPTLAFLEKELKQQLKLGKGQLAIFHGSLDDRRQQELVRDFGTKDSKVRLLLASDAASEGINLHHYCRRLIHYDIPWSLITLEQRNGRIDRYGQTDQPDIRYLLTVPGDEDLKGDLRILERLVEREDAANKNLGDVAWLMNLHDPEKEEERVGIAIANHEDPEEVIPDEPVLDPLLALFPGGTDGAEEATADDDVKPETGSVPSLFDDDLAYVHSGFEELATGQLEEDWPRPEFDHDRGRVSLYPPDDLQRRYAYLPPELKRKDGELKLTTDRNRVKEALRRAREQDDLWPEWELLWNQHPVAQWLNDRVLGCFARHEAPIVRVREGVGDDEALFLMQGVVSNRRSRPILVQWFGVRWKVGTDETSIIDDAELMASTSLAGALTNPGTEIDTAPLEAGRAVVVTAAKELMAKRRIERSESLMPTLQEEQRRVKAWRNASLDRLDAEKEARAAKRKLRPDEERRFEEYEERVEKLMKARNEWIDKSLRTEPEAYIRIAAVLVGR